MIERCGDRQHKCDGLQKWPLNFFVESPGDAPDRSLSSRLWSLPIHVVYQCLGRMGPRRNRDRRHFIIRVSVPNASIHGRSQPAEEGPTGSCLLRCSLKTGV